MPIIPAPKGPKPRVAPIDPEGIVVYNPSLEVLLGKCLIELQRIRFVLEIGFNAELNTEDTLGAQADEESE